MAGDLLLASRLVPAGGGGGLVARPVPPHPRVVHYRTVIQFEYVRALQPDHGRAGPAVWASGPGRLRCQNRRPGATRGREADPGRFQVAALPGAHRACAGEPGLPRRDVLHIARGALAPREGGQRRPAGRLPDRRPRRPPRTGRPARGAEGHHAHGRFGGASGLRGPNARGRAPGYQDLRRARHLVGTAETGPHRHLAVAVAHPGGRRHVRRAGGQAFRLPAHGADGLRGTDRGPRGQPGQ